MKKQMIRSVIIPRLSRDLSYICVGKKYEGQLVQMIRDESIEYPNQKIPSYSVYSENGQCICTIENSPVIVYYFPI